MTRFNLLLLEEGEKFFEDYEVSLYLPNKDNNARNGCSSNKKLSGRLKVASKNLIFEPHSLTYPIIRFPYSSMKSLHMDKSKQHLIVITSQIVEMKAHNVVSPYIFKATLDATYIFEPSYSRLDDFVGLVAKIYQINKTSKILSIEEQINKLMHVRENKIPFDSSWFVDINEIQKLNEPLIVSQLTPLVELRGQLQITSKRIYFQPFHNHSSNPMLKYNIKDIKYIYKRRHIMMPIALECQFQSQSHPQSQYLSLAFQSQKTRDYVYKLLYKADANTSITHKSTTSIRHMQQQWINGNVSNFDYLMFLNTMSGRSFNDLTQYPIFPWIITDYSSHKIDLNNKNIYRDLSLPIGALNPKRLQKILKRYREMPNENKFHFGSHYSSPGYVMYFLVRQYPEYMLRFQNGKFDAADRLFSSIQRCWESVYTSLTDVKELIPQFYDTAEQHHSFLLNTNNLNLGIRSFKQEVHNVELPKWAHSTKHFIETLRAALESDHTCQHLHRWIDLIWGYKQRGVEAEKACNKFYYLTYEGAINIASITDKAQLNSIKMQINEFGQTPSQLFTQPHPQKYSHIAPTIALEPELEEKEEKKETQAVAVAVAEYTCLQQNMLAYSAQILSAHAHRITDLCISADNEYLFSTSHDSTLSVYSFKSRSVIRSIKISHLALSSCCTPFNFKALPFVFVGSWDNNIYLYNNNVNRIQQTLKSWHSDAISCLDSSQFGINSGSWDTHIKIWRFRGYAGLNNQPLITYKMNSEVRCIATNNGKDGNGNILISGDENGNIYMFDTRNKNNKYVRLWRKAHTEEITALSWIPNRFEFISCGSDCSGIKHWNATNGKIIQKMSTKENLNCIETDGKLIIGGGEEGKIRLFNINENNIDEIQSHSLRLMTNSHSISKLCLTNDSKYIAVGTKQHSNNLYVFNTNKISNKFINNHHKKGKFSLPSNTFGSSVFAKLTKSASNLFSFGSGSNEHK